MARRADAKWVMDKFNFVHQPVCLFGGGGCFRHMSTRSDVFVETQSTNHHNKKQAAATARQPARQPGSSKRGGYGGLAVFEGVFAAFFRSIFGLLLGVESRLAATVCEPSVANSCWSSRAPRAVHAK